MLKKMIAAWFREAQQNNNFIANDILGQCYRLVCSSESLMHDPALKRVLHGLMEKMFNLLIGEFRRLGANIVYADFSKVIIATTKNDLKAAVEYSEFVLKTVKMKDEFGKLMVNVSKFYSDLVFLDEVNYGGMEFDTGDEEDTMMTDNNEPKIMGHWNIANYLADDGEVR